MAKSYQYYQPGASLTGCPGTAMTGGWYEYGSSTPIVTSYLNPSTGKPYTPAELTSYVGGGTVAGETTTPTVAPESAEEIPGYAAPKPPEDATEEAYYWNPVTGEWVTDISGLPDTAMKPPRPTTTPEAALPSWGDISVPKIPVTPAPAYEISPEQQEMQDMLATTLTDWVTSGGYGLSPEVQAQMIQQQTDVLKAREQENIRVMKNNMERRGITNSGYVQANMNMITSNTTVAIAGAITDVQIKNALMKMASFEKAMGVAAQFLGYLSEQSQLRYAPEFATWQAEQLATMQTWQGKLDMFKMAINQAYQQQNIKLTAQLQSQLAAQQHGYDIELAEMELEAQQQAAAAEGAGQLIGGVSGIVGSLIAGK